MYAAWYVNRFLGPPTAPPPLMSVDYLRATFPAWQADHADAVQTMAVSDPNLFRQVMLYVEDVLEHEHELQPHEHDDDDDDDEDDD